MKKTISATVVLIVIAAICRQFTSCEKYVLPELSISRDTLEFSCKADTLWVDVQSNVIWETVFSSSEVDWLTFYPEYWEGDTTVTFIVTDNTSAVKRYVDVNIESESLRKALLIVQNGVQE